MASFLSLEFIYYGGWVGAVASFLGCVYGRWTFLVLNFYFWEDFFLWGKSSGDTLHGKNDLIICHIMSG